jgi:hypothetical protein
MGLELILGAMLLFFSLKVLPGDAADARVFDSDWGCRQGTELTVQSASGNCSAEDVTLDSAAYTSRRRGRSYSLVMTTLHGMRRQLSIDSSQGSIAVWTAVRREPGQLGRAQFFRGRVVAVRTASGIATTNAQPDRTLRSMETLTALGAGLVTAALLEFVLGAFVVRRRV